MVNGIINVITIILKWGVTLSFFVIMIFSFVSIVNIVTNVIAIGINGSVIGDLGALIQIWLPFDLVSWFNWIMMVSSLIVVYYLGSYAYRALNGYLKD